MTCSDKQKRRNWWVAAAVIALALIGLLSIDPGSLAADRQAEPVLTAGTTVDGGEAGAAVSTNPFGGSAWPSILKMLSALVLVVFLIYVSIYFMKRLSQRRLAGRGDNALEVMETVYVAPKKSVSLIRVADKSVVVGVTDNGMSLLSELTPDQTAALATIQEEPAPAAGFRDLLQTATEKMKGIRLGKHKAALESDTSAA